MATVLPLSATDELREFFAGALLPQKAPQDTTNDPTNPEENA